MPYTEATASCDKCGSAIGDADSVVCWGCYEDSVVALADAKEVIADLEERVDELEGELSAATA